SSSRATSRPTLRPGLTITSSQRRLAGGRYQGPALRSPSFMLNGPRRVTLTRGSPIPSVPPTAPAATAQLSHAERARGEGAPAGLRRGRKDFGNISFLSL